MAAPYTNINFDGWQPLTFDHSLMDITMEGNGLDFLLADAGFAPPVPPLPHSAIGLPPEQSSTTASRGKTRASLACIPCRSRHSRCDGRSPVCTECQANGRICSYAPSRRGKRRPESADLSSASIEVPPASNEAPTGPPAEVQAIPVSDGAPAPSTTNGNSAKVDSAGFRPDLTPNVAALASQTGQSHATPSKFVGLYYTHFHAAHPIVLPRQFLQQRLTTRPCSLKYLLPVIEYIGSLYSTNENDETKRGLFSRTEILLNSEDAPDNGFTVQALFLLAIASHGCHNIKRARRIMNLAIEVALRININRRAFACTHGEALPVLEESWRRTWWYLFLIDGMLSAIEGNDCFSLRETHTDVALPCEEDEYQSGNIPRPQTIEDYTCREFDKSRPVFSSFSYLIDLGHIIGSIMSLKTRKPMDVEVMSVEASLTNWQLYLPEQKNIMIEDHQKFDDIMFQAHHLFATLRIWLHRPASDLLYNPIERMSTCCPFPAEELIVDQNKTYSCHTAKVMESAERGICLFSLHDSFLNHAPITIPGLTLAIFANMSACRHTLTGPRLTKVREHIRLAIGSMRAMGEVWEVGAKSVEEVQMIARDCLFMPAN